MSFVWRHVKKIAIEPTKFGTPISKALILQPSRSGTSQMGRLVDWS
ncbi:MAG: hypothetical protein ONB05_03595 [candidate division KSB1 bacterium]|nr:hypothetical protein [candidate division KSB1 bacterium]